MIFLIGFMGSGKSYLGRRLAARLGWTFADTDEEVETHAGESIPAIFARVGEAGFRPMERAALERILARGGRWVIATGGGLPTWGDNLRRLRESGRVVWLDPSAEVLAERLEAQTAQRPLLAGLDAAGLRGFIEQKCAERRPFYAQADFRIDSGAPSALEQLVDWATRE